MSCVWRKKKRLKCLFTIPESSVVCVRYLAHRQIYFWILYQMKLHFIEHFFKRQIKFTLRVTLSIKKACNEISISVPNYFLASWYPLAKAESNVISPVSVSVAIERLQVGLASSLVTGGGIARRQHVLHQSTTASVCHAALQRRVARLFQRHDWFFLAGRQSCCQAPPYQYSIDAIYCKIHFFGLTFTYLEFLMRIKQISMAQLLIYIYSFIY